MLSCREAGEVKVPRSGFYDPPPCIAVALREWVVAFQAPLFVVVLVPALLGAAVAWRQGAEVNLTHLGLVLMALVLIQGGANLEKGLVESGDRSGPAMSVQSPFIFDSGAVERLGWSRRALQGVVLAMFGAGGLAGVYLMLTYAAPILLVIGALGAFLGFFYSAPPLKLSYRGVGEVATFLAFGPLLVAGVGYLFARTLQPSLWWAGILMGFLASIVSFERYFPLEAEDREKGKRTPVVILGPGRATWVLWVLLTAPFVVSMAGFNLGLRGILAFVAGLPVAVALAVAHRRALSTQRYGGAIGLAVLLHATAGLSLTLAYLV